MTMTRRKIEALRDLLRSRGIRASILDYRVDCTELALEDGGESYFAYIYPGRFTDTLVAKLTLKPRSCGDALLDPEGLIAIAEDEERLAEKIDAKLERLRAIARAAKNI